MSKTKLTIEVDDSVFFDAVQSFGQNTTGSRLLDLMLSAITNSAGFRTQVGCSMYGIEIESIEKI